MSAEAVWLLALLIHTAHWRAQYAIERAMFDEWVDLGGES